MISITDYELPGGRTDWKAYNRARVNAGEQCRKCGHFIIFAKGSPTLCSDCKALEEDRGEVRHDSSVRCPKCRHVMDVHDAELYDLYEEGEHEISCQECNHEFTVSTRVSYTFESPALAEESAETQPTEPT